MDYKKKNADVIQEGVWDEKTCVRRIGGYDIDTATLPATAKYLPKGTVLAINESTGKVAPVKVAKATEKAQIGATEIKIEKNNLIVANDVIGGHTVKAIDKTNASYDVITVDELSDAVELGTVLAQADLTKVIGLNYATVVIDSNPTCTPTVQAYEIEEKTLPYPVNDAIKEALTVRHAWKV